MASNKEASTSKSNSGNTFLWITEEEAEQYHPNSRVLHIKKDHKDNHQGHAFSLFCTSKEKKVKGSLIVCLYHGVWHQIRNSKSLGGLGIIQALPSIHNYDIVEIRAETPIEPRAVTPEEEQPETPVEEEQTGKTSKEELDQDFDQQI
jgi:hypothetical protein